MKDKLEVKDENIGRFEERLIKARRPIKGKEINKIRWGEGMCNDYR